MDRILLLTLLLISGIGLLMIGSASVAVAERMTGNVAFFVERQGLYLLVALLAGFIVWKIPSQQINRMGPLLLPIAITLLILVLIPGIGKNINGSSRWLGLGPVNFQVSEFAKLAVIIYLAGYLVRRQEEVKLTIRGFIKPLLVLAPFTILLMLEPDFGATAVLLVTAMGMLFLGGVRLSIFALLISVLSAVMAILAYTSPYRMQRLTAFLDPWSDPYGSGFQLTQALIAFGRGEWFGVGLGDSVQKLFYLPEAHTDFVYAVLAEELGMIGAAGVVALFIILVGRIFSIGRRSAESDNHFGAYYCYGVAIWVGLQAFINMGVNMGLLPTKGLTLPLMSYGGSSMVLVTIALAIVLRIASEIPEVGRGKNARSAHKEGIKE